jgi:hypothetical protein
VSIINSYDGSDIDQYFKLNVGPDVHIRQFSSNESLFLISTVYNSKPKSDLYRECRSCVVSKHDDKLKLISYTRPSVETVKHSDFKSCESDIYQEVVEGTSVMVFTYDNQKYFCTARCDNMDESYFQSKISFGSLFDECLGTVTRKEFEKHLDDNYCYEFIIVHHANKFIVNYESVYGANYAKLFLTNVVQIVDENNILTIDANLPTIETPNYITFDKFTDNTFDNIFCIRRTDNTIKYIHIVKPEYEIIKRRRPNYSNIHLCIMQIFINNESSYTVLQYLTDINYTRQIYCNRVKIDWVGMLCFIYKHSATIMSRILTFFTKFETNDKHKKVTFVKLNNAAYNTISQNPAHHVLVKQLATLQYLVRDSIINDCQHLTGYLKKALNPIEFCKLLKSIQLLKTDAIYSYTNYQYDAYVNKLLELISE